MSRIVATLVYGHRIGSMARKAILAYCADRANDDGSGIWPSKQRIAEEVECSRQTVVTTMQQLVDDGLLVENGLRKCRNGFVKEYSIDVAAVARLPKADDAREKEANGSERRDLSKIVRVNQLDGKT